MAYSADFRERVAIALRHGERTQVEIAEDFGVSVSFVAVLHRRVKETGSSAVLPHNRGRIPLLDAKGLQILIGLVRANEDATLEELRVLLGKVHPVTPRVSAPKLQYEWTKSDDCSLRHRLMSLESNLELFGRVHADEQEVMVPAGLLLL